MLLKCKIGAHLKVLSLVVAIGIINLEHSMRINKKSIESSSHIYSIGQCHWHCSFLIKLNPPPPIFPIDVHYCTCSLLHSTNILYDALFFRSKNRQEKKKQNLPAPVNLISDHIVAIKWVYWHATPTICRSLTAQYWP